VTCIRFSYSAGSVKVAAEASHDGVRRAIAESDDTATESGAGEACAQRSVAEAGIDKTVQARMADLEVVTKAAMRLGHQTAETHRVPPLQHDFSLSHPS